ncbi:hypothetical protein KBTX_03922 [wastewater metagenome]|uniref:Uncharacterized protein n=2 Tax=unclassified sequences TaxID=12908 RepID=A0A5B8RJ26_9ZZZZ|nr:hypothetical protein KBTEX_03922 [uncultured organism]
MPGRLTASATSTTVCASAPFWRRVSTVDRVVERFCPIRQYTQSTPWSRWLITASMAMAERPVPSSPMSSWRWPRPTGTSVSMIRVPV